MRLDLLLVEKKLAKSRTQAQDLIKNGVVFLGEKKITKANFKVEAEFYDSVIITKNGLQKYVSRAGLKLEQALDHVKVDLTNKIVLDVGQSTGGFTDCLLQRDVQRVVGFDVGQNQIDESLKQNKKVVYFESLHVKDLETRPDFLGQVPPGGFDFIVADVSFISLTKVIPHLKNYLKINAYFLFLVKPQFELDSNALDKNGLVKDEKNYLIVQNKVSLQTQHVFGTVLDYFQSELQGKDGNQEFFVYGKKTV